ncbi:MULTISPECIES: ribosome biogenesis GTPase Der [unclassified Pseudoclavibacter]|uniref:ribosome biogenesis GTPase Der n=1 Tax=unclassified Pseudoclavibacter TaxID=2615177 RepID=UPI001300D13E|nr:MULTISPECIES: ribosome biogenesis GTPase Der [unclassified Pseudoclavibacter]KAB1646528.1 ribosome biogenesis GTPase Der [Pseudoclavibacter sp. CFCC 14310]KAB1658080.1 ribosome biogenesis GTPase Der [Pseudoclavibacter sp. CFCC 11306]KAB1661973.1 ribosome biogenesis GTPase Der [Pseudoclavibacter sp. CFCC 13796]KAB1663315.1 ribosome biogenesis GTPase Der [Pseudoclavibacter sp. CFCC 13611]
MAESREPIDPEFGATSADELAARLQHIEPEIEQQVADVARAELDDYDLEPEDAAVLASGDETPDAQAARPAPPVLAVIGRPNVGKSSLVNRVLGHREAVVEDTPGVTRDRVSYDAEWNGQPFRLVDTGGWELEAKGLDRSVAEQAELAIEEADGVLFVVDAKVGPTSTDEQLVAVLRRSGKPVLLVANKVDAGGQEAEVAALWSLGLGEPHPVSALHGRGSGDLLDAVIKMLPKESKVAQQQPGGPRRVAIIGRPNVGKSSLLNKATGSTRAVVNDLAGTTRDPVDELVTILGTTWRFVDTAGIRRRVHLQQGSDYYATLRTQSALDRAEVAIVVIDVSQSISDQDLRIIDMVLEAGRALVLAFNKWDLLDDERRPQLEREIEQRLGHVAWAPRVNLSAKTGRHLEKLVPALQAALEGWDTRVPTGKFNAFIHELTQANPHPLRGGKQPRILFGTQADTQPPTFVLFTSGFMDPQYRRFITRRLREVYGFVGTPIRINMRVREKRGRK